MKKRVMTLLCLVLAFTFVFVGCGNNNTNTNNNAGNNTTSTTNDSNDTNKNEGNTDNSTDQSSNAEDTAEDNPMIDKNTQLVAATNPEKNPPAAMNRKDTLIVGCTAPKGDFAPIYSSSTYDSWVCALIFGDGLVGNDAGGNAVPGIAESWDVSPDGKVYTFHLRNDVKFSDGTPVTAEDVAFTYTAIADPNYDGARTDAVVCLAGYEEYHDGDATEVSGIKVIDDYTIEFTLKELDVTALLGYFGYAPMPKAYYNFEKGDWAHVKEMLLQPMGAGPYVLKDYKAGQEIAFEANPGYFRGEPKTKNIIMKVTNADTVIQELQTGGVDIDKVSAKPKNINMLKTAGFIDLNFFADNGYGYLGINTQLPKFSDKRVRQALMYGLNRKGFVDTYYQGYATVCNVPISQVSWAYSENVNPYEYNPETANKLLDEAGWELGDDGFRYKDGEKFEIHWLTYTGSKYVETLIPIVKSNYADLGIDVIPELMEFSTLCEKVYDNQDFEMYNMAWSLSIDPDPLGIFGKAQTEPGGFNAVGWVNERSEELMQAGLKELDMEKRKAIYQEWGEIINEDVPYIFLSTNQTCYAVNNRVKNIHVGSYLEWTNDIHLVELAQ